MTVRTAFIRFCDEFASLPEELLERELAVQVGNEVFPVTEMHLTDLEVKHHTALLWGRVELVIGRGNMICRMSPVKGWIHP